MAILEAFMKRLLNKATVVYKAKITPAVHHIRIQSERIKKAAFVPGYFLRVAVGLDNGELSTKDKIRSYSVWDIDPEKGTIDLAVATDGNGPGAQWAMQCQVGDALYFAWHKGKFLVDDTADSYLMIGDLSALAHLYQINRSLGGNKTVKSIIYHHNTGHLFADIDGTTPFTFTQLPQNPTAALIEQITGLIPRMGGEKMVYIAGDSRVCQALHGYLRRELQWAGSQLKVKPFWNPDKRGLE
jgi:NADPH-dependent ferric siderophore reductase